MDAKLNLKDWATGTEEDESSDVEAEEELEAGPKNPIWAGEGPDDEHAITPEMAEELLEWLEENEPEIHEALVDLCVAICDEDAVATEKAAKALEAAPQNLNPEYEPLTAEEQKTASDKIASCMRDRGYPEKDSPEWKQAVAIGINEARKEAE